MGCMHLEQRKGSGSWQHRKLGMKLGMLISTHQPTNSPQTAHRAGLLVNTALGSACCSSLVK